MPTVDAFLASAMGACHGILSSGRLAGQEAAARHDADRLKLRAVAMQEVRAAFTSMPPPAKLRRPIGRFLLDVQRLGAAYLQAASHSGEKEKRTAMAPVGGAEAMLEADALKLGLGACIPPRLQP